MLLMMLLTTATAWAQEAIGSIQYNSIGGYYEIGSVDNLNDLAVYVNGTGTYSTGGSETTDHYCTGLWFKMTADITYTHAASEGDDYAENFTAIGGYYSANRYFNGNFDGDGHTVSGIRINKTGYSTSADNFQGLFGQTGIKANVHDVHLTDARIKGNNYVGGIVGNNLGTVSGCTVTASTITITGNNNYRYGTICGANNGTLSHNYYYHCTVNCTVNGTVNGTANATNVGCNGADVTANDGAVPMTDFSAHFSQSGDEYTIHTAAGWGMFSDCIDDVATYNHFTGKTVKLDADISVTRTAGYYSFKGTFDGQGHTLTFNYTADDANKPYNAPFHYAEDGCVIENLHVNGTITTSARFAAGIVGVTAGTVNIRNCRSSVTIQSSYGGDGEHGGLVSITGQHDNDHLTIEGCVFDGKIVNTGATATIWCGGFVGAMYKNGTLTITNSLYAPTAAANAVSSSGTFVNGSGTLNNCYYTATLGKAQGKKSYTLTTAPANLGAAVTGVSYTVLTAYENGILFDGKYYVAPEAVTFADNAANDVNSVNGYVADVTLSGRTLTKDGNWNTLCLPFAVSNFTGTPLEGATVKELLSTSNLDSNGTLTLNFTTVDAIEAGKPYIVRWGTPENNPGTTVVNPVFQAVTITSTTPTAVNFTGGSFVGQYSPFSIVNSGATGSNQGNLNEIILMSTGNRIGYSQNPRTLKCFRCHFLVPTSGGQQARSFVLDFGDNETTEIVSVTNTNLTNNTNDNWYTLDGRKLDSKPTTKGLYIVNGRKTVIK